MKRRPVLGCIADDVTGATDLALNLTEGGMAVAQVMGVPDRASLTDIAADAVVVALKTRSIAASEAVDQSLRAAEALRARGVERLFFKYCSTFDSTSDGNIGPVAEALMNFAGAAYTIFCPAFPRNGRTVYKGHLFVNGRLLNESGMQNHPLNPMTDPDLVRFLGKQAACGVGLLAYESLSTAPAEIAENLRAIAGTGKPLIVTDACDDSHLESLAAAAADMPLLTGGSGIAKYLPQAYRSLGLLLTTPHVPSMPDVPGPSLILSGSCSRATRVQVAWMEQRCPSWRIDVTELMADEQALRTAVLRRAAEAPIGPPLMIYSSAPPAEVERWQSKYGAQAVADAIERFFGLLAVEAVEQLGVRRLVLAGGETSGSVTAALGIRTLSIGPEICPGVPWTASMGERKLALALKSGNFGDEQFFSKALGMLN